MTLHAWNPPHLRRRTCLTLAGAALASAAGTPAAAAGAHRPPAGPVEPAPMPRLALRQRRLANGLLVCSVADASTPTASVQMWYRVGGKDDPAGRSGFAHLFEHMMFKSTKHMANEAFDRLTEDVGGQNNAFTAEDMTAYFSDVPSNHLERLLWAEAERLAHLRVDQANFDSERAVVQEELRQRVLADPYGRLYNAMPVEGFSAHPYRRPVVGSIEDLAAATLTDVQQFHRTYYRPDNAVLIVVGEFDDAQFDAWVDRYLGPLQSPPQPIPRVTAIEPRRSRGRRVQLHGPQVPLPAVALLWQGPRAAHGDAAALQVAAALLSGGDSARLNEALVYRARSAQAVGFSVELYADAGMLVAYAIAASGQRLAPLETALHAEIKRLARAPVPAHELAKVKAQILTSALLARQTPQGKAMAIGRALVLHGDALEADRMLQRLQQVRAADVQRVLAAMLATPAVSLHYTQQAGA